MVERLLISENNPNREQLSDNQGLVALQLRLLLGGKALNWQENHLPEQSESDLNDYDRREQTTYQLLSQASTRERKQYWQGKLGNQFEQQWQSWLDSTVKIFHQARGYIKTPGHQNWQILFERLGINYLNFQEKDAIKFSQDYVSSSGQSGTTAYIQKVISLYKTESGFDFIKIEQDLEPIAWLANIFGQVSSDVVRELIYAEAKLLDSNQRAILISENNRENRRNRLQNKEIAILEWLSPQSPQTYTWEYYRKEPDDPQHFPLESLSKHYLNNQFLAQELCNRDLGYASQGVEQIKEQMDLQEQLFENSLNSIGITNKELEQTLVEAMQTYASFIREKYRIQLPEIKKLYFLPIYGLKSALLNPEGQALGFVNAGLPIIFADYGVIQEHARQYGYSRWGELTKVNLVEIMMRILKEVAPHELTHLLGDMAFWKNTVDENRTIPEKWALSLYKPTDFSDPNSDFTERGSGLMEACTVRMTTDWLEAMNHIVKVRAYPAEGQVLTSLIELIATEKQISQDDAFKYFVRAYFLPGQLLELVKVLSGDNRQRPHFLSIIYGLMNYEEANQRYPLTLNYIKNQLNQSQKHEIHSAIDQLNLTPAIKRYLLTQL